MLLLAGLVLVVGCVVLWSRGAGQLAGAVPEAVPEAGPPAGEAPAGYDKGQLAGLPEPPTGDGVNQEPPGSSQVAPSRAPLPLPDGPQVLVVHVAGAVRRPGVYGLEKGRRVADALGVAGGPLPVAGLDLINMAAPLEDGQQVYVPAREEAVGARAGRPGVAAGTAVARGAPAGGAGGAGPVSRLRLSLNRAGAAELDTLPGIGPALAQRIVRYRETNGVFRKAEDLLKVPGIGPAKWRELRDLVSAD